MYVYIVRVITHNLQGMNITVFSDEKKAKAYVKYLKCWFGDQQNVTIDYTKEFVFKTNFWCKPIESE